MKKTLLLVSALIVLSWFGASSAQAGIAIDGTSTGTGFGGGSTMTWTHTVTSTANSILVVGLSSLGTSTAVSFKGTPLTKAIDVRNDNSDSASLWYLLNPPAGTFTVSSTFTSGGQQGSAISFSGVSQSNPIDASSSAIGSSVTTAGPLSLTTNNASEYIVDDFAIPTNAPGTPSASLGQILIGTAGSAGLLITGGQSYKSVATPMTTSTQWTYSGIINRNYSIVSVALAPATGGGTTSTSSPLVTISAPTVMRGGVTIR